MTSQSLQLSRVRGAALDGRASSIRFQQTQLNALHLHLRELRDEICEAIIQDTAVTSAEAQVEYFLAVAAVKHHYDSIDFLQAMRDEYRVARGRDAPDRRVGHGVVVIKPSEHTRFFSILSAVAAAIAAGNTFVVECGAYAVDRLLPRLLRYLDAETYALVDGDITDPEFLKQAFIIDQTGELDHLPSIAVVDRTADPAQAAKAIVSAHMAYHGRSPHAPQLILVNEWIKKDFVDACIRFAGDNKWESRAQSQEWCGVAAEAERNGEACLVQGGGISILDIKKRSAPVVNMRPRGQYLPLLTISSLVDAVVASESPEYLTAWHFAEPAAGKFLSQQINSRYTFINHIPFSLLVGPTLPSYDSETPLHIHYTTTMLSRPRPEFIQPKPEPITLDEVRSQNKEALERLKVRAEKPLRPTGQGKGTAMGFFEQGIIVGAVFIVLPVVCAVGYTGWWVGGWFMGMR